MRRIYTRTGDKGTTAIHGRIRVPKTDIRIEANGTLDELNVAIGLVRSFMAADDPRHTILREIQFTLMKVMSLVATVSEMRHENTNTLPDDLIALTEAAIDSISAECSEATHFVLPGGNPVSAHLHQARAIARRAERRLWQLDAADPLPEEITVYVNRLADLFFVMARREMELAGLQDEKWNSFSHNRTKK